MNSSAFDRQEDSQMVTPKSRLDDHNKRDDVRVDESSDDGDKRGTIAGNDIGTMNTKDTLVHALHHSPPSGDKTEKDHAPMKRDPHDKSGLKSKSSSSTPPAHEKKSTGQQFHGRIKMEEGESYNVKAIDDPPTAITGAGMSETSIHSYYTDNIAAACAATNDELVSGVPSGGSSKGEGEHNSENKRKQKRARHRRQLSSTEDKVLKRTFEQDMVQQHTPESSAMSLVMAELQRENLALVQENAALKQNVQHLSYMLERSLAAPPRGDFNALLAQAALLQQPPPQALAAHTNSLQPHLPSFLTGPTKTSLGGGGSGALQHASDPQVASLLGIGGESSSHEQQAHADQRLRVASILSALGSNNPPSSNPLLVSSVLTGTEISNLTGGQSSSLLEQLLLGASASASKAAANTTTTPLVGGDASTTPTFSELQRYLLEGRGNSSLGGSSHNSSRKGSVTTEPVGTAAAGTKFSSTSQSITDTAAAALPRHHGHLGNTVPAIRSPASTSHSQIKRNKHKGGKHT